MRTEKAAVPTSAGPPADPVRAALNGFPPLRAAVKSRAGQKLVQATRGACAVSEHARFFALECGSSRLARYRLSNSPWKVLLRHGTRDVHIFNEIFGGTGGRLAYEPPSAIRASLDRCPSPQVLDLGANIGLFGLYVFSNWPQARVTSYEPDAGNLALLAELIRANGLNERWEVIPAAISNRDGEMMFRGGLFADSYLVLDSAATVNGASTTSVSVRDLFAQHHTVDLLKMDIEGGEWEILEDPRLPTLDARTLVLEWHRYGCSARDPGHHARRCLIAAGFTDTISILEGQDNGLLWASR